MLHVYSAIWPLYLLHGQEGHGPDNMNQLFLNCFPPWLLYMLQLDHSILPCNLPRPSNNSCRGGYSAQAAASGPAIVGAILPPARPHGARAVE